jgi:hypothetical protein
MADGLGFANLGLVPNVRNMLGVLRMELMPFPASKSNQRQRAVASEVIGMKSQGFAPRCHPTP